MQMTSLANKTVVISGGATGIGLALALEFVSHGAIVVIGSRRQSAIDDAIKASGGKLHGKTLDVVDRPGVNEFMAWVKQTIGTIDILVNAAGVNIKDRSMSAMPPEMWDQVMSINAHTTASRQYCPPCENGKRG